MNQPATDTTTQEKIKPETVGDIINRNHEQAQNILKEYDDLNLGENPTQDQLDKGKELLAESSTLLNENKLLGDLKGGFSKEVTPEIADKISEQMAKAPDMDEQAQKMEIGRHTFLLFMQDITGMDLSNNNKKFNIFDIFKAISAISRPGAMDQIMNKMKDAVNKINGENPNATPKEKLEVATDAANKGIDELKQQEPSKEVTTPQADKGYEQGVNGGALTTTVDNSVNGATPVVDHDNGTITIAGASASNRFNDVVSPAQETVASVDPTVDPAIIAENAATVTPQENTSAYAPN